MQADQPSNSRAKDVDHRRLAVPVVRVDDGKPMGDVMDQPGHLQADVIRRDEAKLMGALQPVVELGEAGALERVRRACLPSIASIVW